MEELNELTFEEACDLVKLGTFVASNNEKLLLYGYFKVAKGETSSSTSKSSLINEAKQKALKDAQIKCVTSKMAEQEYVNLVKKLIEKSLID